MSSESHPADWQPTATLETMRLRAELYSGIRSFFSKRQVLEVETPLLSHFATVDPAIESMHAQVMGVTHYLQTSPEFFMKRLLAAGAGDIYSLGKVFRDGEKGGRHLPEFTLLEWYRVGWDEHALMKEVVDLIHQFLPEMDVRFVSYRQLFIDLLGVDPHQANHEELSVLAASCVDVSDSTASMCKDELLDLFMTHCIEPQLPASLIVIYDFPASKAALAQLAVNQQGQTIARRFEAYLNRIELANGYYELTDAWEQQQRFEQNAMIRQQKGLADLPYDRKMLAAMTAGMPASAGVALGVDRLLMILQKATRIESVVSFAAS